MPLTLTDLQAKAAVTLTKTMHLGKKGNYAAHAAYNRFEKGMVALGFDWRDRDQSIAKAWADAHDMAELQFLIDRDEARRAAKAARSSLAA